MKRGVTFSYNIVNEVQEHSSMFTVDFTRTVIAFSEVGFWVDE